jgi:hypothetical protein
MILEIDVTDWAEEAERSAIQLRNQDDIISAMSETSIKPLQAGRMATVLREMGVADPDILPSNKVNLQMGAAYSISQMIARQRVQVLVNGQTHDVRRYIAQATTDESGQTPELNEFNAMAEALADMPSSDVTLIEYNDELAQERIVRYLMTNVIGRIRERLTLIAAAKGDVRGVAQVLQSEIDNIVKELVAIKAV